MTIPAFEKLFGKRLADATFEECWEFILFRIMEEELKKHCSLSLVR